MMRVIHRVYLPNEDIPVYNFAKNRKLVKYYTRETMAAVVAVSQLFEGQSIPSDMPFYYSTGETEMLDFYQGICIQYAQIKDEFSSLGFIENIVPTISPLQQFKMMRNTTSCFVSIENGLKGDNAVLLSSASGLLYLATLAETEGPVLIGAGKLYADGTVECGFAEVMPCEIACHPMLNSLDDAIDLFRTPLFSSCRL
jgi:hypothetical protein